MAPAWIVTAGCDVLRDEAEEFGERLIAARNTSTVLRCIATIHNFLIIDELAQSGPAIAATTALGRAMWDALHVNTEDTKSKDQENGRNAQAWQ